MLEDLDGQQVDAFVVDDALAIRCHHVEKFAGVDDGLISDGRDPVEKGVQPTLSVAVASHGVESTVVLLAVAFEEEA
ncbi:hypothetical protein FRC98_18805 [Lujinxingia vulgaris]|uniref:Uncharacterized protein n=1 Tax=Lujinxingia vulgaris TaxID=2600176 RepID=A0A5C6X5C5_9DELT|nr:hypothetical protein [Lujinxingia vulgaris]TXD34246.1 hypothetical protein FRC98_18805 [Lujinxingia vulgaris]